MNKLSNKTIYQRRSSIDYLLYTYILLILIYVDCRGNDRKQLINNHKNKAPYVMLQKHISEQSIANFI